MDWNQAKKEFQDTLSKVSPIVADGVKILNALQPVLAITETVDPALASAIAALEATIAGSKLAIGEVAQVVNSLNNLKQAAQAAAVPVVQAVEAVDGKAN
jgi:hypothetical protein